MFAGVLGLVALSTACLADIRPENIKDRTQPAEADKARTLLRQAADALHKDGDGWNRWRALSGVSVQMTDEWYGMNSFVSAWPEAHQPLRTSFMPASDDSVVDLLDEDGQPTGITWGIHDWNTWKRENGKLEYVRDRDIHFTLPTVEYFLEAPFRMDDPSALVDYAGTQNIEGRDFHVIYITWNDVQPQDMIDQYVAYIAVENNRLERIDCTVRDMFPFVTISAYYQDYREVDGFQLPHRVAITTLGDPNDSSHTYVIEEWKVNIGLELTVLNPENRPAKFKY